MKLSPVFICLSVLLVPAAAEAAGFYIQEQGAGQQGESYAGAAANPHDTSTIFYNPAGITQLPGAGEDVSLSVINPASKFRDTGTTSGLTAGAQAPTGGGNGGDPYSPTPVPAVYAASPIGDGTFWMGIGMSAPFGLSNSYNSGWFGRYDSTSSDLQVIDIAPVVAMKIGDSFSIGGGPDIQYADAELKSALPCPNAGLGCGAAFSPASDGQSRLSGHSWSTGYNLGALWKMTADTQVGLHYRSGVTQKLDGSVTISGLGGALAGLNGVDPASAKLKLPNMGGIAIAHDVTTRLKLLGSADWYGWKNFNEIRVNFDSGAAANVTPEGYRNSWSTALGAEWKQTDDLTLKTGVQFDQTPTTTPDRTTRTPDSDRYWISAGASYKVNDALSLDGALSHIFMPDSKIDLTQSLYAGGAASTIDVNGSAANQINIVSVQSVVRF